MIDVSFDRRFDLILGLIYCVDKDNDCKFSWVRSTYPLFDDAFYDLYKNNFNYELELYIKNGGFGYYEECLIIANSLDNNYEVIINDQLQSVLDRNKNVDISMISKLLNSFVDKSNYDEFYNSFSDSRKTIINDFISSFNYHKDFNIEELELFYNKKSTQDYRIILVNFSGGSYGLKLNDTNCYISGLFNYYDNSFGKNIALTFIHEISHIFINELGYKYSEYINVDNVFSESVNLGLEECYFNKINYINEYIVRSCEMYFAKKILSSSDLGKRFNFHKNSGFLYVDVFSELLEIKNNYDSFNEFYKKEIINLFNSLNEKV